MGNKRQIKLSQIELKPISSMMIFILEFLVLPDNLKQIKNDIRWCIIKYNSALSAYNAVVENLDYFDPTNPVFPENADTIYLAMGRTGNLFSDLLRVIELIKIIHNQLNKNGARITLPSEINNDDEKFIRDIRNLSDHITDPVDDLNNQSKSRRRYSSELNNLWLSEASRIMSFGEDFPIVMVGVRPILIGSKGFMINAMKNLEIIHNENTSKD